MPPTTRHPTIALALGLALGLTLPALAEPVAAPTCTVQVSLSGRRATAQDCDQFVAAHLPVLAVTAVPPIPTGVPTWTPAPATPSPVPSATAPPPATSTATATASPVPTSVPPTVAIQTDAQRWGIPDYPEVRPGNVTANLTRGRALDPALIQADVYQRDYLSRIDGNFTGTTEQILEWAALKWFPDQDRDLFKAMAVKESSWNQAAQGDFEGGAYQSFGLLQVKLKFWCPLTVAGCEQVKTSTAFAADVAGAVIRAHYDGALYTGDYATWNLYPIRPDVPEPTRLRRAVNGWYFGDGGSHNYADWSLNRDGALSEYVSLILGGTVDEPGAALHGQALAGHLKEKPWRGW